jgi:Asp-tRNA(Asn)/Glu-tRNA(Gln) amidotransferase B subunit
MRLNYIDITKNINIRNLMVTQTRAKEGVKNEHPYTYIDYQTQGAMLILVTLKPVVNF